MKIGQAIFTGKEKSIFEKRYRVLGKTIRQYLGSFSTRQAGHLIVTAGAIA